MSQSSKKPQRDMPMTLRRLNADVLFHILEEVRSAQGLLALSSTCQWLREASLPFLFRRCSLCVNMPITRRFLPTFAWPYVKELKLFTGMSTLGSVLCPSFFRDALQAMPRLRSVSISSRTCNRDASWEALNVLLSLPRLREFELDSRFYPPCFSLAQGYTTAALAPLTSFRYRKEELSAPRDGYVPEQDPLAFVIKMLHPTLESLELPVESTPLNALSLYPWPRLCQLRLSGKYPAGLPLPLISILSNMSNLRILALHFNLPLETSRQPVWPSNYTTTFPWPELVDFSVSFPDPDDQIYGNLPNSLRRLSLRSCPHHCFQSWQPEEREFSNSPIPSALELIHLLQKCNTPLLDALRIDYVEAGTGPGALRLLPMIFPALTTLEVNRFRDASGRDFSIADASRTLAGLHNLRILRIHLDFSDTPRAPAPSKTRDILGIAREAASNTQRQLRERASKLIQELGRPLDEIWMLLPTSRGATWHRFRVVHRRLDSGNHSLEVEVPKTENTENITCNRF